MARKTVQILDRQTIWDIGIQEYGSIEGAFSLMFDNRSKIPSLDVILTPGEKLKVLSPATEQLTLDYYKKNNLQPVSISDITDLGLGDYNDDYNNDFFI